VAGNLTLAMIKPHIHFQRRAGDIIQRIEKEKFAILLCKLIQLREDGVEEFYAEHKGKDFFTRLKNSMTSGPTWVLVLGKENAVDEWRKIIGNTNPGEASPETIRAQFGDKLNISNNAVHGSSDDWAAKREINFFFGREIRLAEKINGMDQQRR